MRGSATEAAGAPDRSVIFYVEGEAVPATRFRVLHYLPRLRDLGWRVALSGSRPGKYAHPRLLDWKGGRDVSTLWKALSRWRAADLAAESRVAFLQRDLIQAVGRFPFGAIDRAALEARIAARNGRIVFDFDDAIFARRPVRTAERKFRTLVGLAAKVIAGNPYLAEAARAAGGRSVEVIPTPVDLDRYPERTHPTRPPAASTAGASAPVIGWTGSASNHVYLEPLAPVLRAVLSRRKASIRIVSDARPPHSLPPHEWVRWNPGTEVSDLAAFDLGLMYLPDDAWARGKCGFKLVQYGASGIPAVASDLGFNREIIEDGVTGFLVRSPEEWIERITLLLDDPDLRERMGRAARRRIEERFSVRRCFPAFAAALAEVAGLGVGMAAPGPVARDAEARARPGTAGLER